MEESERCLIEAARAHQGGISNPLTYDDQNAIYGGIKNQRENFRPYDRDKLLEAFDEFMNTTPPHATLSND